MVGQQRHRRTTPGCALAAGGWGPLGASLLETRRSEGQHWGREPRKTRASTEWNTDGGRKDSKAALTLRASVSVKERRWTLDDI